MDSDTEPIETDLGHETSDEVIHIEKYSTPRTIPAHTDLEDQIRSLHVSDREPSRPQRSLEVLTEYFKSGQGQTKIPKALISRNILAGMSESYVVEDTVRPSSIRVESISNLWLCRCTEYADHFQSRRSTSSSH